MAFVPILLGRSNSDLKGIRKLTNALHLPVCVFIIIHFGSHFLVLNIKY